MKTNNPLISILMNCYNGELFLDKSISSIYNQTYSNWEIIFIDNCSTDNSYNIIKKYDEKIKYYKTNSNVELGAARAYGLNYCRGDFICFLDTDDIYLNTKLDKQIKLMKKNEKFKMCYTGGYFIDYYSTITSKFTPKSKSGNVFGQNLMNYEINMQSVMIKNDLEIHFDENLQYSPDYDLFMGIASSEQVAVIEEPLIKYRQLANSLSNSKKDRWAIEIKYTLDKLFKNKTLYKNYEKYAKFAYAKSQYYKALYLIDRGSRFDAIKALSIYKFINIKYFILYLLSFMPKGVWSYLNNSFNNGKYTNNWKK